MSRRRMQQKRRHESCSRSIRDRYFLNRAFLENFSRAKVANFPPRWQKNSPISRAVFLLHTKQQWSSEKPARYEFRVEDFFSSSIVARIFSFASLSAKLNRYSIQLAALAALKALPHKPPPEQFKFVYMNTCTDLHVMQSIKSDFYDILALALFG